MTPTTSPAAVRCPVCDTPLQPAATGRPARFCTMRCRQAAYRARRRLAQTAQRLTGYGSAWPTTSLCCPPSPPTWPTSTPTSPPWPAMATGGRVDPGPLR
ncbi:hypothetical protein ACIBKY_04815 [Nonomuraea sp. NPDC050394]|uniref:hypothetical protein n=1 Tax=Nonomuraea sp. NPDC050394 TaxID=3364363 RepID=UPI0037AC4738